MKNGTVFALAYDVPETNALGACDMARDLPDNYDTDPSDMFAVAQDMLRHCSEHLHTCREIANGMASVMSVARPDMADRFEAIEHRVEDKIRCNGDLMTG